ncbi:Rieske (2Fe-2S) protein [Streptomyces sp.]|uniref:Rieske (2Fe-2S) protein n=2 Tax=Streptomyces sp. TaxID=1931 RepID=UPI002811E4F3|nr:Rieske (2Fe-2S) protein [Streptomyces sp.]
METLTPLARTVSALRAALPKTRGPGRVLDALDRWESFEGVDPVTDALRSLVRSLPLGGARDVLHGRWLGHPVHPLMVQLPVGAWLSAAVLDVLPGKRRAARALVATGLAGAAPAAVAGWVDWAELRRPQMRAGLLHAVANTTGVVCYAVSLSARCRGRHWRGKAWGFAGLTAVAVGGALGGHLSYRLGAGANHAEEVPDLVGSGWHELGDVTDLPVDRPRRGMIGTVPVVMVRTGDGLVHVLAERCSHMAGPLAEGTVEDGCLRCPWHGSTFRLSDGWNVTGPATAPQPVFRTRVVNGRLEARLEPAAARDRAPEEDAEHRSGEAA